MGEVEVGAGLAAVVVIGAVVLLARRRSSSEAKSVAGYRETLDVLGHLGGSARHGGPVGATRPARAPRPARLEQASRGAVPVFGDRSEDPPATATRWQRHDDDDGAGARRPRLESVRTGPPPRPSLAAMQRPARGLGLPVVVALVVLAAAAAGAYVELRGHRHSPAAARTKVSHTTTSHPAHSVTTPSAPSSYAPLSASSTRATYVPSTTDYSVTIGATTGPCWVSVTSGGTTLLEQTFAAGASASVTLKGAGTVVLGAPQNATVSIGGVPVELPKGSAGPFTMTFAPH